jgi:GT2 family glycosyltransferase
VRSTEENDTVDTRISVVIPVRNQGHKMKKCLDAVFNQTLEPFEVIVVDGHSTDNTVAIAERFPTTVLYEDYGTRAGANQVGIGHAEGDYIAFTDADCIPKRDWLENLLKGFSEGIVGVGGSVNNIGSGFVEDSINAATRSFLGSATSIQGRVYEGKRFVRSISGCNSMYRKEDLLRVEGFDVTLTTAEDTELNARLRKIGKLLYTPEATILHDHSRGLREFAKRMYQYGYGRGTSLLLDLQVVPPILAVAVLFLPLFNFEAFLVMILLYFSILLSFALHISWREKSWRYSFSTPIVFLIEHVTYTIGIWIGFLSRTLKYFQSILPRSKSTETNS